MRTMKQREYKIRVNLVDKFSWATHSKEVKVSKDTLKKYEEAMLNGTVISRLENAARFDWVIEEIEYL